MTQEPNQQILKCREDYSPIFFNAYENANGDTEFQLQEDSTASWVKQGEVFRPDKLRTRIEPWLTSLFQSEHFSVLAGSGLTHALHHMATGSSLPGMSHRDIGIYDDEIVAAAKSSATASGRSEGNIEDHIRVANELLRGLEIIGSTKAGGAEEYERISKLREGLKSTLEYFAATILKGESDFLSATDAQKEETFNYLVSFLMSFASRSGTRDRLQLFTTNYDRFIEAGADVAGLRLIDRFVGSLAPIFRSSRLDIDMHYNPPGIRGEPRYLEGVARFTKLHGSVDWVDTGNSIRKIGIPFGAEDVSPYLSALASGSTDPSRLMIYPNAAKDRETAAFPYVELFRDFASGICRPNSTLVCYGYSFGDEHINRVIEDMLTIPSAHLVVIAYADPLGRIIRTYDKLGRHTQITLLIGNHLGNLRTLVDHYLPKPSIDRTTFRMAELLKARWNTDPGTEEIEGKTSSDKEDSSS